LNDDGTVNFKVTENETGFIEDDVDLEDMVSKMTKSQIKKMTEEH
jgi:hypothetical protein